MSLLMVDSLCRSRTSPSGLPLSMDYLPFSFVFPGALVAISLFSSRVLISPLEIYIFPKEM